MELSQTPTSMNKHCFGYIKANGNRRYKPDPNWCPLYFMGDYLEAELVALEEVFLEASTGLILVSAVQSKCLLALAKIGLDTTYHANTFFCHLHPPISMAMEQTPSNLLAKCVSLHRHPSTQKLLSFIQ